MGKVEDALRNRYMSGKKVKELNDMYNLVMHNYRMNKKGYFFPYRNELLETLEDIGLVRPFNDGAFEEPRTYWKPVLKKSGKK